MCLRENAPAAGAWRAGLVVLFLFLVVPEVAVFLVLVVVFLLVLVFVVVFFVVILLVVVVEEVVIPLVDRGSEERSGFERAFFEQ